MNFFERFVRTLTWRTAQVGQVALAAAMFIIVANVISRIPWKPVPGTVEIVEMAGAVLLGMGVAYTAAMKGHIMVGVLVEKFSPRIQAIVDVFTHVLALYFTYILARETIVYAARMMARGYVTANLLLPVYPAIYLVAFGFIMLALVVFKDLLKAAIMAVKGSEKE
ncbi:MAG: TRAP transporter small permease [Bacillota bacterium]